MNIFDGPYDKRENTKSGEIRKDVITTVKKLKLKYFAYVMRGSHYTLLRGIVEGKKEVNKVLEEEKILEIVLFKLY